MTLLGHVMTLEPAPFSDEDHEITLKKVESGPLSLDRFVLFP